MVIFYYLIKLTVLEFERLNIAKPEQNYIITTLNDMGNKFDHLQKGILFFFNHQKESAKFIYMVIS